MKKLFSIILTVFLCSSLFVNVSAQVIKTKVAQPYYKKAITALSALTLNGTTAICESSLTGKPDVVKVTAEQYLQKQGFL